MISAKSLAVAIIGNPTKTYNATTAASLTSANYSVTGLIGTDAFTVTETVGTYDLSDAGGRTVTALLAAADFTPAGSTLAGN